MPAPLERPRAEAPASGAGTERASVSGLIVPRGSLLVRTSFVLAISGLFIAASTVFFLNQFVVQPLAEQWASDQAGLLVLSAQTWVELPPRARGSYELELAQRHDLIISPRRPDLPELTSPPSHLQQVAAELAERLGSPGVLLDSDDLIWAEIPMGGSVLQIGFSDERSEFEPLYVGLMITLVGAAIVSLSSLLIVGRIARPLVRAAAAATAFRGGSNAVPLPEQGPTELVSLARSFNEMARDISALLANRTTLLAGISHDLRTPLARMRLMAELLSEDHADPDLVRRLERNLEEMDDLLSLALRFARGLAEDGDEEIDLGLFLDDVVKSANGNTKPAAVAQADDGAPSGIELVWPEPKPLRVRVAARSLRRVLSNLLHNAERYGAPPILLSVALDTDVIRLSVLDRGPGIPQPHLDDVFQPFFRLDASRTVGKGGSGLGLAIVKQLCQAHGWNVVMTARVGGGNAAVVTIPRQNAE